MNENLSQQVREQQVNNIIVDYLQSLAAGQSPNRDELLARYPELADELRTFFADDESVRRMLERLGPRPTQQDRPTVAEKDRCLLHDAATVWPPEGSATPPEGGDRGRQ